MYCTACGSQNNEDANYCAKCGSFLTADQKTGSLPVALPNIGRDPESSDPIEPLEAQGTTLIIRSGGGRSGEQFRVLDTTTIGRSPSNDIFLDDITVSREHAVIYSDGNTVRVEDRASLNGTFVNHERVEKRTLSNHDEIQIGKYKLTFLEE